MKSVLKPYALLLLSAIILLALSAFSAADSVDIHLHDTYFVLKWSNIYFLLGMAMLSMWLISIGTKNLHSSRTLEWVQIILTILSVSTFFLPPRLFYKDNSPGFTYNDLLGISHMVSLAVFAFILAQLILLTNIIIGFLKKWRKKVQQCCPFCMPPFVITA
jgi:hypothetical protein